MYSGSHMVKELDYLMIMFDSSVELFDSSIIFSKTSIKANICASLRSLVNHLHMR